MRTRAVVVLGMHRSGTSLVASGLNALGVYLGDELIPPDEDNQKGFFEDVDVVGLNKALLAAVGCSWDTPRLAPLPQEVRQAFRRRAVELLARKFDGHPLWALKDPRITRLVEFWEEVIKSLGIEVSYVVCFRHPLSVAASLAKRDAIPAAKSLWIWLLHQKEAMQFVCKSGRRFVVVEYDSLLTDPRKKLIELAEGLDLGIERMDAIDTFCNTFVDAKLRHHMRDDCKIANGSVFSRDVVECFDRFFVQRSPETFLKDCSATELRYNDLLEAMETVDEQRLIHERIRLERENEIASLRSQLEWMENRLPVRLWRMLRRKRAGPQRIGQLYG